MTIKRGPPKDETWAGYRQRFPNGVAVASRIVSRLTPYLKDVEPTWGLVLRPHWITFQRPGRFDPVLVHVAADPVEFVIKLRECPRLLGHEDPYSQLKLPAWWDDESRQWHWPILNVKEIPSDLTVAVDMARKYQPETGEMDKPLTTGPCDRCTCARSRGG